MHLLYTELCLILENLSQTYSGKSSVTRSLQTSQNALLKSYVLAGMAVMAWREREERRLSGGRDLIQLCADKIEVSKVILGWPIGYRGTTGVCRGRTFVPRGALPFPSPPFPFSPLPYFLLLEKPNGSKVSSLLPVIPPQSQSPQPSLSTSLCHSLA